jgi:hypothetical protein
MARSKTPDPEGLVSFEAGGRKYHAIFGFKAMKAVEAHYDQPFLEAIAGTMPDISPEDMADRAKLAAASMKIRLTDVGQMFQFALLKHHPDLTDAETEDVIDTIGMSAVSGVIGEALAAALVEADDGSAANPPRKPRGGKTGSRS